MYDHNDWLFTTLFTCILQGRNNMFQAILLFFYHIKTKEQGMLGSVHFVIQLKMITNTVQKAWAHGSVRYQQQQEENHNIQ